MSTLRDAENLGRITAFDRHRGVERPGVEVLLEHLTLLERMTYGWGYLWALAGLYPESTALVLVAGLVIAWFALLLAVILGVGPF